MLSHLERKGMIADLLKIDVLPNGKHDASEFKAYGRCECNMMGCKWIWYTQKFIELTDSELTELYNRAKETEAKNA